MRASAVAALALCVGAAVALAGCAGGGTLDRAATQTAVAKAADRAIEPTVVSARCPTSIPKGEGRTFRCTVTVRGVGRVPVAVDQTDGHGSLRVRPLAAVLADAAVADQLRAELRSKLGRSFQVTCGTHAWRIWKPGDTFPCRARDAQGRRSVDVTVDDANGTLSFAILPAGH